MNENQINEITQQVEGGITPTEVEYDEFAGTSVYGTEPSTTLDGGQEEIIETEVEEVEQASGVEMIEGEPMTDATDSGTEMNHALLYNREAENQHPIGAITGLSDRLKAIEAVKRAYAKGSSFAEFKQWYDSNPSAENRAGYFVYIVPNSDTIKICGESNEVYGVTTSDAAFVGNQVAADRSDDWTYSMVSLIGTAKVRVDATVRTGDYVVPNADGEATLSENNYGYKVLSMGSYPEYNYAVIALVPQSSTLNKILGSLSGGEFDLGNILLEIEDIRGTANNAANNAQIAIDTSNMTKGEIEDILGELENQKKQITTVQEVSQKAQAQAEAAEEVAQSAQSSAVVAAQAAQSAKEEAAARANQALSEVSSLKDNMQPLAEWSDPETGASGVVGFVAQANADHTTLATIVAGGDSEGSDLSAIKQTKDIIQHLVSHMDRYAVGELSLSYGLSAEEADEILTDTYIYVATNDHEEQMGDTTLTFKRGYAYTWNPETDTWTESAEPISTATKYKAGTAVGDLWYCWQSGITQTDENGEVITTYEAGTLYRWYGFEWVAVATVTDNYQSRITSSVKQTADSLQSDVVALDDSVSTMRQDVDGITTLVGTSDGNTSTIIQRVGKIEYDVYNENGTISSIQQQANDNSASIASINTGRFHVVYQSFLEAAPEPVGDKYSEPPMWDDVTEGFVFNDTYIDNEDGIYYFIDEDQTKYCCVTDDGYDIYTIGNKATSLIHSRIDDTESRIDLLAEFDTKTSESLAGLTARADANEAEIDLVAARYNHILLSVSTEEVAAVGDKYTKAPTWNSSTGQYEFNPADRSDDGTYYMADEDNTTYCSVVTAGDDTVLYETYGLAGSSVAALQQKVDDNSASIGMVVDKDGVKGSAIVEAINGESTATINADKIKLTGTDEISLAIQGAADKMPFTVTLTATSQMFVQTANTNVYTPSTITLTAVPSGEVTSYRWRCNNALMVEYNNKNTVSISYASIAVGSTTFKVECTNSDDQTCSDVISIAKLTNGKDGTAGEDGVSYYTWIKYADDANGTNMSDSPKGKTYMGLAHNKTDINESSVASDYQWSLIKGADGVAGADGEDGTTYYTWVKYAADDAGTNMSDDPTDKKYIGLAYNKETATESNNASDYQWALFRGADGINGKDGENGKDGQDGQDGADGYTIILSNEYVEIPVYASSKPKEPHTITSVVSVYKGTTKLTVTNTTPTENTFQIQNIDAPSYLTATSSGDTVTVNVEVDEPIADLNEVVLTIALYGDLTLTTVIKIRANMNNGEAIVSLINQTDDTITINAEHLELGGYVTITDLADENSTTQIHGSHIMTGTLTSELVDTSHINATTGTIGGFTIGETSLYNDQTTYLGDGSGGDSGNTGGDNTGGDSGEDTSTLPSGYTQVEYIQSSGTQYINTQFAPDQNTRFIIEAQLTDSSKYCRLCGCSDGTRWMSVEWSPYTPGFSIAFGLVGAVFNIDGLTYVTIVYENGVAIINGHSKNLTGLADAVNCNIYLFANNSQMTAIEFSSMKLYACKIYDNETLMRNFIPCVNSSGVAGLYDTVTSAFFANAGSGSFTVGPTVSTAAVAVVSEAVTTATVNPGVYLGIDGIGLGHGAFYVDNTGYLYSNSGSIGGFDITASYLSTNGKSSIYSGTGVYVGTDGIGLGSNFYVDNTGYLTAKSGSIGGVYFDNYSLQVRDLYYDGKVTLSAVTDVLNNTETVRLYVGPTGYAGRVIIQPNSEGYLGFFGSDGTAIQHISSNITAPQLAAALVAYGLFVFGA